MPRDYMNDWWDKRGAFPPSYLQSQSVLDVFIWYFRGLFRFYRGPVYFTPVCFMPDWKLFITGIIPVGLTAYGAHRMRQLNRAIPVAFLLQFLSVFVAAMVHKWPFLTGDLISPRNLVAFIPSSLLLLSYGLAHVVGAKTVIRVLSVCFVIFSSARPLAGLAESAKWNTYSWAGQSVADAIQIRLKDRPVHVDHFSWILLTGLRSNIPFKECADFNGLATEQLTSSEIFVMYRLWPTYNKDISKFLSYLMAKHYTCEITDVSAFCIISAERSCQQQVQ